MVREFKEETGIETQSWKYICKFSGTDWEVHIFMTIDDDIYEFQNLTDEECDVYQVGQLPSNVIYNLNWVIPMCLDIEVDPKTEIKFR